MGLVATTIVYIPIMIITFMNLNNLPQQIGYIKSLNVFFVAQAHEQNMYMITGSILVIADYIWYYILIKAYKNDKQKLSGYVAIFVSMIIYTLFMVLNALPNGKQLLFISLPTVDFYFIANNVGLLFILESDNSLYNFIYKPCHLIVNIFCPQNESKRNEKKGK